MAALLRRGRTAGVVAQRHYTTFVGADQAQDQFDQSAFPGAIVSGQRHAFAWVQIEADSVDRALIAVYLGDCLQRYRGWRGRRRAGGCSDDMTGLCVCERISGDFWSCAAGRHVGACAHFRDSYFFNVGVSGTAIRGALSMTPPGRMAGNWV